MKKILIFSILALTTLTIGFFSIIHFSEQEVQTVTNEPKQEKLIEISESTSIEENKSDLKQLTVEEIPHLKIGDKFKIGEKEYELKAELDSVEKIVFNGRVKDEQERLTKIKNDKRIAKIKAQVLSEEKPIEYIDEDEQRIMAYKEFDGEVGFELSEFDDIKTERIDDFKTIHFDIAALTNQHDKIKQIQFEDPSGGIHVLNLSSVDDGLNGGKVYTFENSHSVGTLVIDKNLDYASGKFTLIGELVWVRIKANKGYIFTMQKNINIRFN